MDSIFKKDIKFKIKKINFKSKKIYNDIYDCLNIQEKCLNRKKIEYKKLKDRFTI
jgi:hypothetical protein